MLALLLKILLLRRFPIWVIKVLGNSFAFLFHVKHLCFCGIHCEIRVHYSWAYPVRMVTLQSTLLPIRYYCAGYLFKHCLSNLHGARIYNRPPSLNFLIYFHTLFEKIIPRISIKKISETRSCHKRFVGRTIYPLVSQVERAGFWYSKQTNFYLFDKHCRLVAGKLQHFTLYSREIVKIRMITKYLRGLKKPNLRLAARYQFKIVS